jgi:6-phosphogluconolactonase
MIEVEVLDDPDAAGRRTAELVASMVEEAVTANERFALAISGGEGPSSMFRALAGLGLPWSRIDTWQVDERVADAGDDARNRTRQSRDLPSDAVRGIRWMPVESEDLDAAADRYATGLPERFDVVHLGLGADGHTASLVPDDPVLDVADRDVALTAPYQGHRRMTLTYRGLARADRALWLVTGEDKREAVERLLAGDGSIPAGRVTIPEQRLVADRAAAPRSEGDAG